MARVVGLDDIRRARTVIDGVVASTPVLSAGAISGWTGMRVVLKAENLQRTGAFKLRGAVNRMSTLSDEERARGVVAASAGNHAQGVALAATALGVSSRVYMPVDAPLAKQVATADYGAEVVLAGETFEESFAAARADPEGRVLVPPFDDPAIIAGQGTIGLELLADHPDLDAIIVPIGGGGLISGIAVAAKALSPRIEVVGAEAALYPSMRQALGGGTQPTPAGGQTIAEGIAVKDPGKLTRVICAALVADILLVAESALERAVAMLLDTQKLVVEGAGAAGLAALLTYPERFRGRKVALVLCGGNIDARLLSSILMRGLVRAGKLVRLRVEISDSPGVLSQITRIIGDQGANIVEIYHQRLFQDVPVKLAEVEAVLETRNADHVGAIVAALEAGGFHTRLLSSMAVE
jgi:threonine dehydratase